MRITSNMFPSQLVGEANSLQQQQSTIQDQIASGLSLINGSDNPDTFSQVELTRAAQLQSNQYASVTNTVQTRAQDSYSGMSSLQTVMSKVGELVTQASGTLGVESYHAVGEQMVQLANQIAQIANQKSADGSYLYGGIGNVAPLTLISPAATSPAPLYEINPSTAYTSTIPSATINYGLTLPIGLTAGNNRGGAAVPATQNYAGFLSTGVASSTDTYTLVAKIAQDLLAATAGTTDPFVADASIGSYTSAVTMANTATSLSSENVGKAAAQLTELSLNSTTLNNTVSTQAKSMSNLTSVNTAEAATQLTQVQAAYQAALQSGAKILNMSLLNYLN